MPSSSKLCSFALALSLLACYGSCGFFFSSQSSTPGTVSVSVVTLDWHTSLWSPLFPSSSSPSSGPVVSGVSSFLSDLRQQQHFVSLGQEIHDRYDTLSNTSEVQPFVSDWMSFISIAGDLVGFTAPTDEFPFKQTYSNNEEFVSALIKEDPYLTSARELLFEHAYPGLESSAIALSPALYCVVLTFLMLL